MGERLNHYPRHVGDITQATFGLSLAEFGCYDRLLDAYYSNESPLPLDPSERYRLAGAHTKADRAIVNYVVGRFFVLGVDGWHNKRADEEIVAYRERAEQARRNGRHGGRPANPEITDPVISDNPSGSIPLTGSKASHKPVASNQEVQEPLSKPAVSPVLQLVRSSRSRATRLPEDWRLPDDWKAWAAEAHGVDSERAVRISLVFRDYWHSTTKNPARLNWFATWRNWIRKEVGDVA